MGGAAEGGAEEVGGIFKGLAPFMLFSKITFQKKRKERKNATDKTDEIINQTGGIVTHTNSRMRSSAARAAGCVCLRES